jgi:hypothetical protein
MMKRFLPGVLLLAGFLNGHAQDSLRQEQWLRTSSFIPIPIVYYTPETRFAGGAALSWAFRFRGQNPGSRPSQAQLGLAYTQERQFLFYLPFQLFLKEAAWQVYGELGYYRYAYQFFGIGNETLADDREVYSVDFPRLRLNGLRLIAPNHYLGLRYAWDDYRVTRTENGGLLEAGEIPGSRGGVVSTAGLLWNFDSRDDLFYPSKGWWVEGEWAINNRILGSNFAFSRASLDIAGYFSRSKRHILALNAWLVFMQGEPPFQHLAFIGGPKKMRGYFEGRLRDKNLWMLQAEYRAILIGRLGWAAFGGVGAVGPEAVSLFSQSMRFTAGAGLRFRLSKKDHINLRLDAAVNEKGEVFPYLTVKEAF